MHIRTGYFREDAVRGFLERRHCFCSTDHVRLDYVRSWRSGVRLTRMFDALLNCFYFARGEGKKDSMTPLFEKEGATGRIVPSKDPGAPSGRKRGTGKEGARRLAASKSLEATVRAKRRLPTPRLSSSSPPALFC